MTKILAGRTALVTGASRGIGRAIALRLAADGAFVMAHYGSARAKAEEVVAEIAAAGGSAVAIGADLAEPLGSATLAEQVVTQLAEHRLDILVNNAGISVPGLIETVDAADFARVLQVNLQSPFFLIQALLAHLADGGRIINVSSMGTRSAYPAMATYAPAKAGLEALTLLLAAHLGPRGITVNAVRPGATATDMNTRARDPVTSVAIAATVALGRVGQPEDIAGIVAFLASEDGRWVTGQCLDASGGQRI